MFQRGPYIGLRLGVVLRAPGGDKLPVTAFARLDPRAVHTRHSQSGSPLRKNESAWLARLLNPGTQIASVGSKLPSGNRRVALRALVDGRGGDCQSISLGGWPSGLRRLHGVQEIGSSNLPTPTMLTTMFYVYVLRSHKNGYRYIGQTNNLERRLREHNEGLTKSIKFQLPFAVEFTEEYSTRVEAVRREKFLKSGQGREWLDQHAPWY